MLNLGKIVLGIILGLFLSVTLTVIVRADVVWEPEDSFYQRHRLECKKEQKRYIANGEDGYVAVYKSPVSGRKLELFKNGYEFYFPYSYLDDQGEKWGLLETVKTTGWVRMEETLPKYDNISFCEEHEDEFQEYNGEYEEELAGKKLIIWEYPCSGEIKVKLPADSIISIPYTYTDQNGNVWGMYEFPQRIQRVADDEKEAAKWDYDNGWIYLSDPDNDSIPALKRQDNSIPAIEVLPPLKEVNKKSDMAFLLIGALTLVISVTAGILVRMKMKK